MADTKNLERFISQSVEPTFAEHNHAETVQIKVPGSENSSEIKVLYYDPEEDPFDPDDIGLAMCITAGVNFISYPLISDYVEVGFHYIQSEPPTKKDYQQWADELAKVIVRLLEMRYEFILPTMLDDITFGPFDKMTHVLVTDWYTHGEMYFENTEPPVRMLRFTPLYKNEADYLRKAGLDSIDDLSKKLEDYKRKPSDV